MGVLSLFWFIQGHATQLLDCPFDQLVAPSTFVSSYADKWVSKRTESQASRLKRLESLGLRPKGFKFWWDGFLNGKDPIPRVVSKTFKKKYHGGGESSLREHDQYGDVYGHNDDIAWLEILGPYFNVARVTTVKEWSHSGNPRLVRKARFLAESSFGFPRELLQEGDLQILEPLPQNDPLLSYLGVSLVRILTRDGDKTLPLYSPDFPREGVYRSGQNYFRRLDGSYYLYDIHGDLSIEAIKNRKKTSAELERERFAEQTRNDRVYYSAQAYGANGEKNARIHVQQMFKAIETLPSDREKRRALDYLIESVFMLPHLVLSPPKEAKLDGSKTESLLSFPDYFVEVVDGLKKSSSLNLGKLDFYFEEQMRKRLLEHRSYLRTTIPHLYDEGKLSQSNVERLKKLPSYPLSD